MTRTLFFALAAALALAACSKATQPRQSLPAVGQAAAATAPSGADLPEVEFSSFTLDLASKTFFGIVEGSYNCGQSIDLHRTWTQALVNDRMKFELAKSFVDTLTTQGYDATSYQHPTRRPRAPEIQVAATLTDFLFNFCVPERELITLLSPDLESRGEAYFKVRWTLFDLATRTIVATVETEGTGTEPNFVMNGNIKILNEAFADATRHLLADPKARAILSGRPVAEQSRLAPATSSGQAQRPEGGLVPGLADG